MNANYKVKFLEARDIVSCTRSYLTAMAFAMQVNKRHAEVQRQDPETLRNGDKTVISVLMQYAGKHFQVLF